MAVHGNKPPLNAAVKRRSRQRPISAHSSRKRTEIADATDPDEPYRLKK